MQLVHRMLSSDVVPIYSCSDDALMKWTSTSINDTSYHSSYHSCVVKTVPPLQKSSLIPIRVGKVCVQWFHVGGLCIETGSPTHIVLHIVVRPIKTTEIGKTTVQTITPQDVMRLSSWIRGRECDWSDKRKLSHVDSVSSNQCIDGLMSVTNTKKGASSLHVQFDVCLAYAWKVISTHIDHLYVAMFITEYL